MTVRPVSRVPFASRADAVSDWVEPTITEADAGVTLTLATGGRVTVIVAVATLPSSEATMSAEPAETPVTSPVTDTVATVASELVHVGTRPVSTAPVASMLEASSTWEPPTRRSTVLGVMLRLAVPTVDTVTVAVALLPSTVAEITAVPGATAVTSPCADIVATA